MLYNSSGRQHLNGNDGTIVRINLFEGWEKNISKVWKLKLLAKSKNIAMDNDK